METIEARGMETLEVGIIETMKARIKGNYGNQKRGTIVCLTVAVIKH